MCSSTSDVVEIDDIEASDPSSEVREDRSSLVSSSVSSSFEAPLRGMVCLLSKATNHNHDIPNHAEYTWDSIINDTFSDVATRRNCNA